MPTKPKTKQQEIDAVRYYEDSLDNALYECLEIAKLPTKWGMDLQGTMVELFPHPIVNRESTKVTGIEYKPYKNFMLPELLLERLAVLENEIDRAVKKAERDKKALNNPAKPVKKAKPKTEIKGRPSLYTQEDAKAWAELREQGVTFKEISLQYNVNPQTIGNYIKRYAKKVAQ